MTRHLPVTFAFLLAAAAHAEAPRRVEFTRLIDHLVGYDDPSYLKFIEDVKPEVIQVGWYGAHLYGPSPYEKWNRTLHPLQLAGTLLVTRLLHAISGSPGSMPEERSATARCRD
jgi:hypothetical protein